MTTKRHSTVQGSVFFKKTIFTLLKSIYFYFKTPTKEMLVFLEEGWGKI